MTLPYAQLQDRQVIKCLHVELVQELLRGSVQHRPTGTLPTPHFSDEPPLQELSQPVVAVEAADRLDLGQSDRLLIGHDREHLHDAPGEPLFLRLEVRRDEFCELGLGAKLKSTRDLDDLQ